MNRFADLPIQRKLLAGFVAAIALALAMTGVGVVAANSVMTYTTLRDDLSTFARIIADNSTGSLAFNDPQSASENLAALRTRTNVVSACLYRADGTILADYRRDGETASCARPEAEDFMRATFRDITVSRAISLPQRRLGALVLVYDLNQVYSAMARSGIMVSVILLIVSVVAFRFASSLRSRIVSPILQLVEVTGAVSRTRDYSLRATKDSDDEIGLLAGCFNEMLSGIQSRDAELTQALAAQKEALDRLERVNQDLNRSNRELARSNEDLERFAFVASHDLQEPLRMVSLFSQLLIAEWPGGLHGQPAVYAARVRDGAQRMRDLLTSLLAYAEIAGAGDVQAASVDVNAVLAKVKDNLRLAIEETGAEITSTELPTIVAHEAHMVTLFQNLVSNALKYRGAEPPRVHVAVERKNGFYQFAVSDNGTGIDPKYHAKIFMAFKRLHGRDIPGTGIGLAICQRTAERYGGRLWVQSEAGQGSTFFVTLAADESVRRPHG